MYSIGTTICMVSIAKGHNKKITIALRHANALAQMV
jgi:hypothetical protein